VQRLEILESQMDPDSELLAERPRRRQLVREGPPEG